MQRQDIAPTMWLIRPRQNIGGGGGQTSSPFTKLGTLAELDFDLPGIA